MYREELHDHGQKGCFSRWRARLADWHRYLDVVLGAVLVLAGVLKGQQLLADPSVGRASGLPRELLLGASAFELAFGCWLLAALYRRLTRWLALAWFTSLAAGGAGASSRRRCFLCLLRRVAYSSLAHVLV